MLRHGSADQETMSRNSSEKLISGDGVLPSSSPVERKHHHSSHSSSGHTKSRDRSKTLLVRQSASLLKGAPPTIKEEEVEVVPKFDIKRAKMMNVIIGWSKNLSKSKLLELSQAFNKLKYHGVSSASFSSEVDTKKGPIGEQKNAYLLLFKENEKLRELCADMRRSSLQNEKSVRDQAMRSIVKIIHRTRQTSKKRYYYDIWFNNTRMMHLMMNTNQRSIQLEVGLQKIESERHYVQKLERNNIKLQQTLAMTVCFFNWKGRAAQLTLNEERSNYEKQRKLIFSELIRIRKIVNMANKQEVAVLYNAISRGDELATSLEGLNQQLARAAKIGKSTTGGLNTLNANASNAAAVAAIVSAAAVTAAASASASGSAASHGRSNSPTPTTGAGAGTGGGGDDGTSSGAGAGGSGSHRASPATLGKKNTKGSEDTAAATAAAKNNGGGRAVTGASPATGTSINKGNSLPN
jgi:hypothetical protein